MSKVSFNGIFVNNESKSKLPTNKLEPCPNILLEKQNECLIVCSLIVIL